MSEEEEYDQKTRNHSIAAYLIFGILSVIKGLEKARKRKSIIEIKR